MGTILCPQVHSGISGEKRTREGSCKKNINPHRLGSRGYVGKQKQWAKEIDQGKCPEIQGISSERAQDCLMGRRIKVGLGEYILPDNIRPIADKIVEKDRQLTQGVWVPEAGGDTLTAVLGPEHPVRTRAVGHNVGLRLGLPGIAEKRRNHQDRADLEEIAREIHEKMAAEYEVKLKEMAAKFSEMERRVNMVLAEAKKNDATPAGSLGSTKATF